MSAPSRPPRPDLDPVVRAGASVVLAGPPAARDAWLARWLDRPEAHTLAVSERAALPWEAGLKVLRPDPAAGMTPTALLRAFLRQDPDAIVLDAAGDAETWQVLIQAALTGHQVLATVEAADLRQAAEPVLEALRAMGGLSPAHLGWLLVALEGPDAPAQVGWLGEEGPIPGWERGVRTAAPLPPALAALDPAPAPSPARSARRRRLRLVAAALALLVALAAGELAARLAVLGRVQALDKDAWHEFDATLGWRGKPGWIGEGSVPLEPPRRFAVRLNARGLRMDREVADAPSPGTRRLCLVGDSYVFGWGVEAAEACPARLEALLGPGWEVLNLGTCAYGVDQMRLVVEREALPLHPDLIVVAVIADDFRRALRAVANVGHRKPRFVLQADGTPRLTGVPVPPPAEPGSWQREDDPPEGGSFLLWRAGELLERLRIGLHGGAEGERLRWRLGEALLRDAQRLAAAQGVPLVVALLPMRKHLGAREGDPVRPLLLGLDPPLPVCDAYPAFLAATAPDELFIPVDGHPSPAGQALQAEALAGFLRQRGLLPPPR